MSHASVTIICKFNMYWGTMEKDTEEAANKGMFGDVVGTCIIRFKSFSGNLVLLNKDLEEAGNCRAHNTIFIERR